MTAPERIYVYVAGSPVCRVLRQEWTLEPSEVAVTVEYIRADLATPAPDAAAIREAALREAANLVNRIVDGERVTAPCPDGKKGCLVHHFRMEDGPTAKAILALIPKGADHDV